MSTESVAKIPRRVVRNRTEHDDAPLFLRHGRTYVPLLRKQDALDRLQAVGLNAQQAGYQLLTAARSGTVRSTLAHAHAWLYVEADVDALADDLRANAPDSQG